MHNAPHSNQNKRENRQSNDKLKAFDCFLQHRQPNPVEDWLSEKAWTEVVWASRLLRSLQPLMDDFRMKIKEWRQFYDSPNPQDEKLPKGWEKLE